MSRLANRRTVLGVEVSRSKTGGWITVRLPDLTVTAWMHPDGTFDDALVQTYNKKVTVGYGSVDGAIWVKTR